MASVNNKRAAVSRSTLRYRNDPIYRADHILKSKKTIEKNDKYEVHRNLRKLRTTISNWRSSIEYHQGKIAMFRARIARSVRKREALELEWGALRARIKKGEIIDYKKTD